VPDVNVAVVVAPPGRNPVSVFREDGLYEVGSGRVTLQIRQKRTNRGVSFHRSISVSTTVEQQPNSGLDRHIAELSRSHTVTFGRTTLDE
jgi:hypothetical protein